VTRIGRDTDNDVVVASSHISRYHAEIRWDGRQYVLHDLGSKNGTVLNGRRLTRAWPLADGDVLTFADLTEPSFVFGASERTVTVGRTNMG
jgi:pSer/pThr/pTyr-binding forkhead associated (FHA) protein